MITRKQLLTSNRFATYQVNVQGKIDQTWIHNFQGITTDYDGETTTLKGIVADQSALRGLLCYLWDFNLMILSVALVSTEDDRPDAGCVEERK